MTPPPASGPKPVWLKVPLPRGERFRAVRAAVESHELHTVCREAHCPNIGECWASGTATFLILGDVCTRGCGFCAVTRGDPGGRLAPDEADRVARAAATMGLDYVVVTSVTRDDLPDGGATVFAATVRALRRLAPAPLVEVLTPDYLGEALARVLEAAPAVLAHNLEVVERLAPVLRHARFSYRRSLQVLERTAELSPAVHTKSSLLLGLGETEGEVRAALEDLRDAGTRILVLGQYLRPSPRHAPVQEYLHPDRFEALADEARGLGFECVVAGPLVRTSYRAAEAFVRRAAVGGRAAPPRAP